jgi:hypothetical protein
VVHPPLLRRWQAGFSLSCAAWSGLYQIKVGHYTEVLLGKPNTFSGLSLAETPGRTMTNFIAGRFEGQVALVVGGAQGIRKAIAVCLSVTF